MGGADTAQRIFSVIGANDEDDALDELQAQLAIGTNAQWDDVSLLRCSGVVARRLTAVGAFEVTASYAIPPNGTYPTLPTNPLDAPWSYQWQSVTDTIPFDRDVDGNSIQNSARAIISPPPTKTITYKTLKITRNERFYDQATYTPYENTVNSDAITFTEPNGSVNTYAAGTVKCVSIEPGRAYTNADTFVPIVLSFEIYDLAQISVTDPHQLHFLDQGSTGWFSESDKLVKGHIVSKDLIIASSDEPLNGKGKPINENLKILGSNKSPNTAVNFSDDPPAGATVDDPGSGVFFLVYKRYKTKVFLPLLTIAAA